MSKPYPSLYYGDYLHLSELLACQTPRSAQLGQEAHEEMLFIVTHQAYELWFKLVLHELGSVIECFSGDYLDERTLTLVVSRLERIREIFRLMLQQLEVLQTMGPLDFLDFRDYLYPASGFQSFQFRMLENRLGIQKTQRISYHQGSYTQSLAEAHRAQVEASEQAPTLFENIEKWLARTPFVSLGTFNFWDTYRTAVNELFAQDREQLTHNPLLSDEERTEQLKRLANAESSFASLFSPEDHAQLQAEGSRRFSYQATQAALLILLYRDQPILHMPYRLLQTLMDLDDLLTTWRYRHAVMVQRMIGIKVGTGGSAGFDYLMRTVFSHKLFTDLTALATYMIPRAQLPALPKSMEKALGFHYYQGAPDDQPEI